MKKDVFNKMYEEALETAEDYKKDNCYDEVEVVLVPYVVCRKNGHVATITQCNTRDIE